MSKWFEKETIYRKWKKERVLPEWAKQIFSENIVAAGNVNDEDELSDLINLSVNCVQFYISNVGKKTDKTIHEEVRKSHNRYAYYQRQNPHTPKTLKALGFESEIVDSFIEKSLFPEI
jgi:hypothetical protein